MSYTVHNLEAPAVLEAKSLSLCWEAYAKFAAREDIMEIGFNDQSGYVYIALENGISIASKFGQEVEYIYFDHDSDTETFHDSYIDATIIYA
jgi:hypothetical protein